MCKAMQRVMDVIACVEMKWEQPSVVRMDGRGE
jgi:hypothetical protein